MPGRFSAGALRGVGGFGTFHRRPGSAPRSRTSARPRPPRTRSRASCAGAPGKLNTGDPVFRNEVVKTGQDPEAKLVFLDSTNLAVGPISRVVLDRFVYEGGEFQPDRRGEAFEGPVPLHHRRARQERLFGDDADGGDRRARHGARYFRAVAEDESDAERGPERSSARSTRGAAFEQLARDCSHGEGSNCHCTGLDQPGETVEVTRTGSGGTTQASLRGGQFRAVLRRRTLRRDGLRDADQRQHRSRQLDRRSKRRRRRRLALREVSHAPPPFLGVSVRALIAGLAVAASPGAAYAACTSNVFGPARVRAERVFLYGDHHDLHPVSTGTTLFSGGDPGYGFVANGGGTITTANEGYGPLVINTPNANGALAVWSSGAGSTITLTGGGGELPATNVTLTTRAPTPTPCRRIPGGA